MERDGDHQDQHGSLILINLSKKQLLITCDCTDYINYSPSLSFVTRCHLGEVINFWPMAGMAQKAAEGEYWVKWRLGKGEGRLK